MPLNDGTGPKGHGPMTGRGNGFCILQLNDEKSSRCGDARVEGSPIELKNNKGSASAPGVVADMKEANQMPRGNGTGPDGMGPMTGRGAGYCAGYASAGYVNSMPGRGCGMGRGISACSGRGVRGRFAGSGAGLRFGRGGWNMPYSAPTREEELEALRLQSEGIQSALKDVQQRMQELAPVDEKTEK